MVFTFITECLFQSFYFDRGRCQKEAAERPKLELGLTWTLSAATVEIGKTSYNPYVLSVGAVRSYLFVHPILCYSNSGSFGLNIERSLNFGVAAMRRLFGRKLRWWQSFYVEISTSLLLYLLKSCVLEKVANSI